MRAAVPADVRHADAVMPALRRSGTTTPCAPNAAADRTMAPRFRGSVTPSTATIRAGRPESLARASRSDGCAYWYGGATTPSTWRVRVLVRRDHQRQTLVDRVAGEPVEFRTRHLQQRNAAVPRTCDGLVDPFV